MFNIITIDINNTTDRFPVSALPAQFGNEALAGKFLSAYIAERHPGASALVDDTNAITTYVVMEGTHFITGYGIVETDDVLPLAHAVIYEDNYFKEGCRVCCTTNLGGFKELSDACLFIKAIYPAATETVKNTIWVIPDASVEYGAVRLMIK